MNTCNLSILFLQVIYTPHEVAVIKPFTKDEWVAGRGDRTLLPLTWKRDLYLAALAGKSVKFRFLPSERFSILVQGQPPDSSEASHGYVADGQAAYEATNAIMNRTQGLNR